VSLLDAALGYAHRGWRVFPLHGIVNGVCTCGRSDCGSAGKHPLVRRGLYEATADSDKLRSWWRRWRSANIGIATGAESGIVVIDIDLPAALPSLNRLLEQGLERTLTGLTGGGGIHLVFRTDDLEVGNSAGRLPGIEGELPGIDLRGNGGYVVAPPSVHISGRSYEWFNPNAEPAVSPEWLKQSARIPVEFRVVMAAEVCGDGTAYGLAVFRYELDRLNAAQAGTRNHQLNRSAFALAQLVAGGELIEKLARAGLLGAAMDIGLEEAEALQTIDSAFDAGTRSPRVAPHRIRR
jgi:hypothetical protein